MFRGLNKTEAKAWVLICDYFLEYHRFPKYRKLAQYMGYKGTISNYRIGAIYKALVAKNYLVAYKEGRITHYRFKDGKVEINFFRSDK